MSTPLEPREQGSSYESVASIYQILYEIAGSSSGLHVKENDQERQMEAVLNLLIQYTSALKPDHSQGSLSTTTYSGRFLEQASFVLDQDYRITSFSLSVPETLGHPTIRLLQRELASLLLELSLSSWEQQLQKMKGKVCYHGITALTFLTRNQIPVPAICTISRLLNNPNTIISALFLLKPYSLEEISKIQSDRVLGRTRNDAKLIQCLHDYIMEHLDRPLPTIRQLARMLGTNEFKLKEGFRHYFNTGMHQFHNNERLGKAKLLVIQTDLPLNVIAEQCGFNSYPGFSKAFKKKFGLSPQHLKGSIKI